MSSSSSSSMSISDHKEYMATSLDEDQSQDVDMVPLVETKEDGMVVLRSSDGKEFVLSYKAAKRSELIISALKHTKETTIFISVQSSVLEKIVSFLEHHKDDASLTEIPKPLPSNDLFEVVGKWDATFIDMEQKDLLELVNAANYLIISPLIDLCCAKVASWIKGKTREQIRKHFNIQSSWTEEEEKEIMEQTSWVLTDLS